MFRRTVSALSVLGLVFLSPLLALAEDKAKSPPTPELSMISVNRLPDRAVEINLKFSNRSSETILLPRIRVNGLTYWRSLNVMYLDRKVGWCSVGPFYDVPSDEVEALKPGEELNIVQRISDPSAVVRPGKFVPRSERQILPLGGTYRVRVSYYPGRGEWQKYLMLTDEKLKKGIDIPRSKDVDSPEFEIAALK